MHYVNASATVFVNFLIKNSQEKHCNYLIASSYFVKENTYFTSRKKRHLFGPRQTGTAFIIWETGNYFVSVRQNSLCYT